MENLIPLLQKNKIFKEVPLEEIEKISELFRRKYYRRGIRVCQEGETSNEFFILVSGQVSVLKKTENDSEVELAYLGPGDFFGDMPLLPLEARLTSIQVVIDAEVLEISKDEFENAIEGHVTILKNLVELLSLKLRQKRETNRRKQRTRYPIISVYSTEEQIGKTLLAVNMAASLVKEAHKKVIVVDMGIRDNGLARILDIPSHRRVSSTDITSAYLEERITNFAVDLDAISIVPELLIEESKGRDSIARVLSILKDFYDYILIDTCSRLNRSTFEAIDLSNMVLFITSNSSEEYPLVILDHQEVRTILNLSDIDAGNIVRMRRGFHVLPRDYEVASSFFKTGRPFILDHSSSELSKSLETLARDIEGKKIGLALGGGSARGMAHVGILQALEENGIPIDMISGASAGALIGSAYAAGISIKTIKESVLKWGSKKRLARLIDFQILKPGLLGGNKVNQLYLDVVGDPDFSELKIPLCIIAMDLNTGEEVVFDKGSVLKAVRASLSIPGVFVPVHYAGRYLIDGSVVDPVPVKPLVDRGADITIAVSVTPSLEYSVKASQVPFIPKAFDIVMRSLQNLQYEITHVKTMPASILIAPEVGGIAWTEFFKADKLIDIGRKAIEEALPDIHKIRWRSGNEAL
jgi:NTE family protein